MSRTKDNRSFSVLTDLLDLFQTVFVDHNLLVNGGEDGFHHLSHASQSCVVVVGDDCLDVRDGYLLALAVDFVLGHVLHQLSAVVRKFILH